MSFQHHCFRKQSRYSVAVILLILLTPNLRVFGLERSVYVLPWEHKASLLEVPQHLGPVPDYPRTCPGLSAPPAAVAHLLSMTCW